MARPLQIEMPGGCYHVINRGNFRFPVLQDAADLERLMWCALRDVVLAVAGVCRVEPRDLLIRWSRGNTPCALRQAAPASEKSNAQRPTLNSQRRTEGTRPQQFKR